MAGPPLWNLIAGVASCAALAGLQILWWLDSRQWHRRMIEGIRAHGAELREAASRDLTRRAGGSRPPLP